MSPDCVCGHQGGRHHDEQPYPCEECECAAFQLPPSGEPTEAEGERPRVDPITAAQDMTKERLMREAQRYVGGCAESREGEER